MLPEFQMLTNGYIVWFGVLFIGVFLARCLYLSDKRGKQEINANWSSFANEHGWVFSEGENSWYKRASLNIKGQIEGTPFTLKWSQEGSYVGKDVYFQTHITAELASPYEINITPSSNLLSSSGNIKTGDRLYDLNFITRSSVKDLILPDTLRRQHLAMPASVFVENNQLHLILRHNGDTDLTSVQAMIGLARAWIKTIRGENLEHIKEIDSNISQKSYIKCLLSKWRSLFFWVYIFISFIPIFLIHSEETKIAWSMSWKFLGPASISLSLIWLAWRWYKKRSWDVLYGEVTKLVFGIFGIWMTFGPWILTWNVMVGPQEEVEAGGPVVEKIIPSGKYKTRFIIFYDLKEQRNVKVSINPVEYEMLHLGDSVRFKFIKGSLGIYYNK